MVLKKDFDAISDRFDAAKEKLDRLMEQSSLEEKQTTEFQIRSLHAMNEFILADAELETLFREHLEEKVERLQKQIESLHEGLEQISKQFSGLALRLRNRPE